MKSRDKQHFGITDQFVAHRKSKRTFLDDVDALIERIKATVAKQIMHYVDNVFLWFCCSAFGFLLLYTNEFLQKNNFDGVADRFYKL